MQTTNLPACVKDKVDHACRRFLWSGVNKERKLSQVSWSIVCKPKISGGLGFKNLNLMNQAMLMKFFWALFPRPRACRLKFYARRTGLILGFLRLNYLTKMVPIFGARWAGFGAKLLWALDGLLEMVRKWGSGGTVGLLKLDPSLTLPLPPLVKTFSMKRWLTLYRWTINGSGCFLVICYRTILSSKLHPFNRQILLEVRIRFIGQRPAKLSSLLSLLTTTLRAHNMREKTQVGFWPGDGKVSRLFGLFSGQWCMTGSRQD